MSIIVIKQSSVVMPAEEKPKQTLWLSRLDMLPASHLYHSTFVFVYQPTIENKKSSSNNNDSNNRSNNNNFFNVAILKESLSKVLVPFYPMAGRLKEDDNGRIEIDCNGEGALFVEAEATRTLTDFGDFKPTLELKKLLVPSCDYSKGLGSFPLFMVQLTRFRCGGVTLGFAMHHHVADGSGYIHFINSWARLAKGLELELMPIHERTPYLSPRNPPQVKFQHLELDPPQGSLLGDYQLSVNLEDTTTAIFKFTKDQINTLKQNATTSEVSHRLSTYEVLAGHIWRTTCRARGQADDQEVRLYIPTNIRHRLKNPALPKGFCGNAPYFPACIAKSRDVTHNPLWYIAKKIHETLKKMTDEEYLRSAIDYLETHPNFETLIRGPHTVMCPNLSINSWFKLAMYEADFGWGRPLYVGHGGISREGHSFLVANSNGDGGFSLFICLFTSHITLFEKYLYDFSEKRGSKL